MASINLNSNLVKTVMLKVIGDGGDANKMLDEIAAKAEALKELHPELTVSIDRAKAMADATLMKAELRRTLEGDPIKIPVDADPSLLSNTIGKLLGSKLGGLFGGTGSGLGSGIPYIGKLLGSTGPVGAAAALLAITGSGLTGVIPALLAAGAGAGAFGALAYPTVSGFLSANSSMANAQGNYQTASQNLVTAIAQSPADLQAYNAALAGLEPDLKGAAKLLTDQNVQWQNLSPSMQNSVIALRDNSAAYKTLLPDQKTALDALIKAGNAWNGLTPAQQQFSVGAGQLAGQYDNLVAKMEPLVSQVTNLAIVFGEKLLPVVGKFAQDSGPAIVGIFKHLDTFASSPGFKSFVDQMARLSGPSLTAVANGLGQVAGATGNLLVALVSSHSAQVISGSLAIIAGSINAFAAAVQGATVPFTALGKLFGFLGGSGGNLPTVSGPYTGSIPRGLGGGLTSLAGSAYTPPPAFGPGQRRAYASGGFAAGWALVGENGPELVRMPAGAQVYSSSRSAAMLGGGAVQLQVLPGSDPLVAQFVAQIVRFYVHAHGGGGANSVQVAFGG